MKAYLAYRPLTKYEVAEAVKQRTRRRRALVCCALAVVGLVVWVFKG